MAYIPPHKRHSKDTNTPSPSPALFVPSNKFQLHRNSKQNSHSGGKIVYARDSISRWFIVPFNDHDPDAELPCPIHFQEFSYEPIERSDEQKPLILVHEKVNNNDLVTSPSASIVEKIKEDLLTTLQKARREMCTEGPEKNVPRFLIRFGKIIFQGRPSISVDSINKTSTVETILSQMKRRFHTDLPNPFVDAILDQFDRKIELQFQEEKEYYYVKVFDKNRPHVTISCKCRITNATGELDLCKVELNEVRQMVADISCIGKSLDLRILLSSKRILTCLSDDETRDLNNLIKSAIIDLEVKGGLRWPLGQDSLSERYTVVGVWHTKTKIFRSSLIKLKLRYADRFDFRTSTGEVSQEANLRIPELKRQLRDRSLSLNPISDMVSEALKLAWDHFLCWDGCFT